MMSDLVVIEKQTAAELFKSKEGMLALLNKVSSEVLKTTPDISTAKGRSEIKSLAYKVAQSKTYVDGVGKEIVDELKELPKIIDENRKVAREFLDSLRDKVRDPLTKWEEEQEKSKKAEEARIYAEALAKKVEEDHEIAIIMNRSFDLERAAEIERKAVEEAAKMEAVRVAAMEEAEARAKAQIRAAELEAELERKKALDAIADAKRKMEADLEKQRREEQARIENEAHVRAINNKALNDLVAFSGLTPEQARSVIIAIAKRSISNVSIKY